jgi:predicted dehydrogenase
VHEPRQPQLKIMNPQSRRRFLRNATLYAGSTALAGPFIRSVRAGEPGPNDKIRLGVIGTGNMGRGDLECFLRNPDVDCVVLCDLDDAMLAEGLKVCVAKARPQPAVTKDFRRVLDRSDVDAVLIATPDHWHALPTVMACQAGKDVYVEKPLATSIAEGRAMLTAVTKHQRVAQMGSQWRSCRHMQEAAEFIRSGKLGKIHLARAWANLDWLPKCPVRPDAEPPAGVDYDFWLGPAPRRPFNPNRFHFNFRWYWDYAGGLMTDWGVHLINMLFLALPAVPPKSVSSSGTPHLLGDAWETPGTQMALYEFPGFNLIWEHLAGLGTPINGYPWGVAWYGEAGMVVTNDAGWEVIPEKRLASVDPEKHKGSGDPRPTHVRNFLDCMRSRQSPALNLELGHQLSTVAHLGNLAFRTGAKLDWDAQNEKIIANPAADALVGVRYRSPWKLDSAPGR